MKKFLSFLSDSDGLSSKDYLMIIFTGVYIIQQCVCFVAALMGKLNETAMTVTNSLDMVVMTIIGGVFSVQVVQEFKKPKDIEIELEGTSQQDQTYQP